MMYRSHPQPTRRRSKRRLGHRVAWGVMVCVALVAVIFISARGAKDGDTGEERGFDQTMGTASLTDANTPTSRSAKDVVVRRRLDSDQIPAVNIDRIGYRELFNDSNYVQLSAARHKGIDPDRVGDPAHHSGLVPIFTTADYKVDTMYHSVPYLTPETVLLLQYIGQRFSELMQQRHSGHNPYRVIVTSALRTEDSERKLRRVNRNATDTSCHIYGTTFDLSAQRYQYRGQCDTVVDDCKRVLAQVLYELRYEGLCYVKYERGSCFHITMRTTQYEGKESSSMRRYVNPGSPEYLSTRALERPIRPMSSVIKEAQKEVVTVHTEKKSSATRRPETNTKTKNRKSASKATTAQPAQQQEPVPAPSRPQRITERERLSLEQFERRY